MEPQELFRPSSLAVPRPGSAPPDRRFTPNPPESAKIRTSVELRTFSKTISKAKRPDSAIPRPSIKPLAAGKCALAGV